MAGSERRFSTAELVMQYWHACRKPVTFDDYNFLKSSLKKCKIKLQFKYLIFKTVMSSLPYFLKTVVSFRVLSIVMLYINF